MGKKMPSVAYRFDASEAFWVRLVCRYGKPAIVIALIEVMALVAYLVGCLAGYAVT